MSKKKRRTRSQKIIAQLRRELEKQQAIEKKTEAKSKVESKKIKKPPQAKSNLYTYDQSLIKKDLLKTFYLSLLFFTLIGFFYWYFGGFFPL